MTTTDGCRSTTHVLSGLEPDNLLAFLALLGLLKALERARPEWKPRVFWEGKPPRAVLKCEQNFTVDDLAQAVMEEVSHYGEAFNIFHNPTSLVPSKNESGDKKKIPEQERVGLLREMIKVVSETEKLDHRLIGIETISALARQGIDKRNYYVEDTPLKLPSGQQAFVGAIKNHFKEIDDTEQITRALFSKWRYFDKGDSLRLSPQEDRRYAYRFNDPSPEGARTERGANILASIGLTCLSLSPGKTNYPLVAYFGLRNNGFFTWPIWLTSSSLAGVISLMRHPELVAEIPMLSKLKPYGVIALMRCRRYTLPSGQGDYGNVTCAKPFVNFE